MLARGRNKGLGMIEPHVTLALLLGIVKRMRVQKGPHELAADIFETKFEVGVLIYRVMPAKISGRTNHHPLLVGYFFGANQAGGVTGPRGRARRIVGRPAGIL